MAKVDSASVIKDSMRSLSVSDLFFLKESFVRRREYSLKEIKRYLNHWCRTL